MDERLLKSLCEQLNIPFPVSRDEICDIVYSVAGIMALSSLWDHDEDESSVSIQHVKERIFQIYEAYTDFYPGVNYSFPDGYNDVAEEIYSVYLRAGYFYHSSHQVSPALFKAGKSGNTILLRGFSPETSVFMSGLGCYSNDGIPCDMSVSEMFNLQAVNYDSILGKLLNDSDWETVEWPESVEFLRLDPPFVKGYWQNSPIQDGRISLARFGDPDKIFVFYKSIGTEYKIKRIPMWAIKEFTVNDSYAEYRRIATALLSQYGTLPQIEAQESGGFVYLKVGYRLPPAEENFFRLYSWPRHYDFSGFSGQYFNRKMSADFYPAFKLELVNQGYSFKEG